MQQRYKSRWSFTIKNFPNKTNFFVARSEFGNLKNIDIQQCSLNLENTLEFYHFPNRMNLIVYPISKTIRKLH